MTDESSESPDPSDEPDAPDDEVDDVLPDELDDGGGTFDTDSFDAESESDLDADLEAIEQDDGVPDEESVMETIEEVADEDMELSDDDFDQEYSPQFLEAVVPLARRSADYLIDPDYDAEAYFRPETAPVEKDLYSWEHFKIEHYYADFDYESFEGTPPTAGEGRFSDENANEEGVIEFDEAEYLGCSEDEFLDELKETDAEAAALDDVIEENTVHVPDDFDEDVFFETVNGEETVVTQYDVEKTVPSEKKKHFREIQRYWVNKPYAFIVIYRSEKENETKYYVIEPYLTAIEDDTFDFLMRKLRNTIKYSGEGAVEDSEDIVSRAQHIEQETFKLLSRYEIYDPSSGDVFANVGTTDVGDASSTGDEITGQNNDDNDGLLSSGLLSSDDDAETSGEDTASAGEDDVEVVTDDEAEDDGGFLESVKELLADDETDHDATTERDWVYIHPGDLSELDGKSVRPEPTLIEEDSDYLSAYQVQKLLYYLKRDFVGYEQIDAIKNDINVEDISVDGYNQPVFVYHTDYEQIISNVYHGESDLDQFVVKLAQRSGKGISKRQPQVDCTLPDGSRAQLTLGEEVSDHGTNYTIRQFKDVPFTPVDLVAWKTFSLEQMAFLWLCIENKKSLIFAGGTASGKTTSLNAISLFIPSTAKIVSIEDTREVELPQRNWVASVTRPSFSDDDKGDVDEFDLLEAALRQRPDYIVMGEIRGEEGRTLFQVMSTGHTTYTTFHADSVGEVLKRFTTDPINVSKTMFTALDLVSIQTQTRVQGRKVRRNKTLTEVNEYNPENDEINVDDVYEWQAETDRFMRSEGSSTLEEIKFDRGWSHEKMEEELFKRKVVLAYLIDKELNEYAEVAASLQAFINDPETILDLIAEDRLVESLGDLREMESVSIDIDQEKEDLVPRPTADDELSNEVQSVMEQAHEELFDDYGGSGGDDLAEALDFSGDEFTTQDDDDEVDLLGDADLDDDDDDAEDWLEDTDLDGGSSSESSRSSGFTFGEPESGADDIEDLLDEGE